MGFVQLLMAVHRLTHVGVVEREFWGFVGDFCVGDPSWAAIWWWRKQGGKVQGRIVYLRTRDIDKHYVMQL